MIWKSHILLKPTAAFIFAGCCLISTFFLAGCEAQVQKSNFRTVGPGTSQSPSPSPSISRSENAGTNTSSASLSPSPTPTPTESFTYSYSPSSPSPSATQSSTIDQLPPVPGQDGAITAANITSTSLMLSWQVAADNKTFGAQLQYLVYQSTTDNLKSLEEIEGNGTALGTYIPDLDGKTVSDLNSSTTYYFNIVVKDTAGNKAIYAATSATTTDITAPVPGAGGVIAASSITATSLNLSWSKATDSVTPQASLQYLVFRSVTNNLTTVFDTENFGTAIGTYSPDINSKAVTGLVSSRTYYFTVIAKDAANNKAVYGSIVATTLDISPPVVGASGVMSGSAYTHNSLTLNWTKGADNQDAQANIEYLVYQSSTNNIASVNSMETNGTPLGSYAANFNSKAISGLSPNTSYYFNVIARDTSGNKSSYTALALTTYVLPPTLPGHDAYAKISTAWSYIIPVKNGLAPFVYAMTAAPSGAAINTSTGNITYTPGATTGTQSFTVQVTDAVNRTATRSFTLNIYTFTNCVWTGALSTDFDAAENWVFCNGGAPLQADTVVIDAEAPRQPTLYTSHSWLGNIQGFGPVTSGGDGGTLSIAPGVSLVVGGSFDTYANRLAMSDVKIQGSTPTCTTCVLNHPFDYHLDVTNNATLTLGSGLTYSSGYAAGLVIGSSTETAHIVIAPDSSNPAEWPTFEGGVNGAGGISVTGPAGSPSSISIDGLNFTDAATLRGAIFIDPHVTIKKMRNINFTIGQPNAIGSTNYIAIGSCTGLSIEDFTWSGLNLSEGVRNDPYDRKITGIYANTAACTSIGQINVSGSGRAYGLEFDPGNMVDWAASSSSTCTWTGSVDSSWINPSNWSNCSNGRNNYPDQLDWVIVPVTANQPVVSGNQAMQGTATATGGGTITVSSSSSLYVATDALDTLLSSVRFRGGTAGCSSCMLQFRGELFLGDGVTLTLLPDIHVTTAGKIYVGESAGRPNRAANFVVQGGANAANYPIIESEPNVYFGSRLFSIIVDGSTTANSTVSIDGLILSEPLKTSIYGSGPVINFKDRYTVTQLDHLKIEVAVGSLASLSIDGIQVNSCANSSLPTTWNDLTFINDAATPHNVVISAASCSAISPITISGQGAGYGNTFADDPNNRLTW